VNYPETAPPPDEARIAANKAGQGKPGTKKRKADTEAAEGSASASGPPKSTAPPITEPQPTVPPKSAAAADLTMLAVAKASV
jgi:hypothetical protein